MRPEIPSKAAIWGHPIHPILIPFPIASLVGVLVTDLVYTFTGDLFWANASRWLLLAGLVTGAAAGAVGAIDYFGIREVRRNTSAMAHGLGNVTALLLSLVNLTGRLDDPANTSIALSLIVALILGITGWLGGELSYRHKIGVNSQPIDELRAQQNNPMRVDATE
jgi:uncharacterized membrane protein